MARCKYCGNEKTTADGCSIRFVNISGKRYKRIYYRNKQKSPAPEGRCPDCGAKQGYLHHWGCVMETCPCCGGRMAHCSCRDISIFGLPPA